jgi:16S rRNA (adenine1518-N6/adenine1519-N6)-dimethyltransferase
MLFIFWIFVYYYGIYTSEKIIRTAFSDRQYIADKIAASLTAKDIPVVLEIGPGTGILTRRLLQNKNYLTYAVEIDEKCVEFLSKEFPEMASRIIHEDFISSDLKKISQGPIAIIGNFPYNISSQIFFKLLENRSQVPEMVCMIQKEVALRISAPPGSKTYGILSVLLQAWYNIEYLFTVNEKVFSPPPKVKSGVIRLTRNDRDLLDCDEDLFFKVVKTSFNQRRKMLSNSLKPLLKGKTLGDELMNKRPETLSVAEFVRLTNMIMLL